MNFISLAISIFIFNNILITITRLLPIRKKRVWQFGLITFFNLGSLVGYIWMLVEGEFSVLFLLSVLGNVLGILIAYIASMMIILEGVTLFKSKRMREFERSVQMKDGKSIPRHIIAFICLCCGIVLAVYGSISLMHYDKNLLFSIIGSFIGTGVGIGLALYFFITGNPQHKTLKAQKLLFLIKGTTQDYLYTATLSKDFTIENAIGKLKDIYILDEYGLLITPKDSFIVKGIKADGNVSSILSELQMEPILENPFEEALKEFQKYNRKKIILDENNQVIRIKNIK